MLQHGTPPANILCTCIRTYIQYMTRKTFVVVPRGHPRIVVRNDVDLPCGQTRIFHGFSLKMVETRRRTSCATTMLKDRERHRKDRSNYHCRNRAPFDIPSVHFTMIFSMASLRLSTGSNARKQVRLRVRLRRNTSTLTYKS